jgi:hypothetical protein
MPHRTERLVAAAALALIFALFAQTALGVPYRPRFVSPVANYWTVAVLAALTPLLAFYVARSVAQKWLRRSGLIGSVLLLLPCVLVSSCAAFLAPSSASQDAGYELVSEAKARMVTYRLYRTNCGATCAYSLELREELDLPLGTKLVSPKWSKYRASHGVLKLEESSVLILWEKNVLGKVVR